MCKSNSLRRIIDLSSKASQGLDQMSRMDPDVSKIPARDLLSLPVLLDDVREVAEESVWKVISPKGVIVFVDPQDDSEPVGRLRGMQMVEVELAVGPWLKLKKALGWVRAQGGSRGDITKFMRRGPNVVQRCLTIEHLLQERKYTWSDKESSLVSDRD